ncbi:hypothetical protein X798_07436 [Onchocerca flexuosa]|uniref:DNA helicase DnaB-like N-terminal domain-containing protein n=1 Tax=Onchocerca flexuosa TaxID=387005 RepID=A0A238BLP8_9BILA|nr:hypothetical protein X798_07436 [Onchocerca flexuosa]
MSKSANFVYSRDIDKEICKLSNTLEAEQMLICAVTRDNKICNAVENVIVAGNLYDPSHQSILIQRSKIRKHGIVANELSLKMFFENDETFTKCGGVECLEKLAAKANIALDIHTRAGNN